MRTIALLGLCFMPLMAFAQTACPIGTAAGSMGCGPSPSEGTGGGVASPRPSGKWEKTWGAIAASGSGDTGIALKQKDKKSAVAEAKRQCSRGGASDCKELISFRNQCAALVAPANGGLGGSWGRAATLELAVEDSMKGCEKTTGQACRIVLSGCSEPRYVLY
jgi:hypothetical protein